jgi:drug/metabolite transporter (DMT)-like permease
VISVLLAAAGSVVWGGTDFAAGRVSRRLPSAAVVAWGQATGLVVIGVWVLATGRSAPVGAWAGWAALAGLAGATTLILFYRALAIGMTSVVAPLVALGVLLPVAVGSLTGSPPSPWQWAGVVLGVAGAAAASGPELRSGDRARSAGVRLALVAAPATGVYFLAFQRGAAADPVLTLLGMRAVTVTLFALFAVSRRSVGGVHRRDLPVLVLIGLADASGNVLFGLATRLGNDAVVAVVGGLYPVATVLFAAFLLRERLRPVQWAGSGLALAAIALLTTG